MEAETQKVRDGKRQAKVSQSARVWITRKTSVGSKAERMEVHFAGRERKTHIARNIYQNVDRIITVYATINLVSSGLLDLTSRTIVINLTDRNF
jgi:hypothetical protein